MPPLRNVLVGLFALSLTACGTSKAAAPAPTTMPATTTSTTSPEQAVIAAARGYAGAFFRGDGAAVYADESSRCRAKETEATAQEAATAAAAMYGSAKETEIHATVTGDHAVVTGAYDIAALNTSSGKAYVKEAGVWKWDGCP